MSSLSEERSRSFEQRFIKDLGDVAQDQPFGRGRRDRGPMPRYRSSGSPSTSGRGLRRQLGGRLDGPVRGRRRVRSHQDLAPTVVASFVHGTACPEATADDGHGTSLAMGCRHAPEVVQGRIARGSPPPLVDTGTDGSIYP